MGQRWLNYVGTKLHVDVGLNAFNVSTINGLMPNHYNVGHLSGQRRQLHWQFLTLDSINMHPI